MHYLHFQSTQVPLLIFYLLLGIEKFNPDSDQAFLEVLLIYELYFKARTAFSPMCLLTFGRSSLQVSATLFHAHSSVSFIQVFADVVATEELLFCGHHISACYVV